MAVGAEYAVRHSQQQFRLGVLTNRPAHIQRLKLDHSGLARYFDAVVVSGEAGVGKPSPEPFGLVLDVSAVGPEGALMVGDSWDRDVKGALAAGISAVWVARGRPVPDATAGGIVIRSVGGLSDVLEVEAPSRTRLTN